MTASTHIERHVIDAALRGEPVRRPVSDIYSNRLPSESRADVCGPDTCGVDRDMDVSSQTAADLDGSAAIFGESVNLLLARLAAVSVFAVWWVFG